MTTLAEIRDAAMQLSEKERQELGWELVDSAQKEPGYDQAWGEEVARRIDDLDSGRVKAISHDELMAELREMRRAYEA
ncbi:MAG: addiction module protein [Dehalococcoidia bacterium]